MKELWLLEYNKYIFLFYGETLPFNKTAIPNVLFTLSQFLNGLRFQAIRINEGPLYKMACCDRFQILHPSKPRVEQA